MNKDIGYKIRVNCPEHSLIIQEKMFKLGYSWAGWAGGNKFEFTEKGFLYIDRGLILHSDDETYYKQDSAKEITLKELIRYVEHKN